jgi:hypothetical protein
LDTLVSIVIDNYNYARFLPLAIDSALAQTYEHVEVVVVDDGSTDSSLDVLAGYGSRIVAVTKANGGQASALNAGYAACRGDVVLFLDSDDVLYPDAVAEVLAVLRPETAKVHGALDEVDADGRPLGRTNPSDAAALADGDVLPSLLSTGRYVCPVMSGNAYTRWLLDRIMPIPEQAFVGTADGYLVALAGLHGPVAATPRPLGRYRRHGSNAWGAAPSGQSLSKHVAREMSRYQELRREGAALGLQVHERIDLRDISGLRSRLSSLRLAGVEHPVPSDSRLLLVRCGVRALWRTPEIDTRRRVMFTVWFLVVGFAPLRLARHAITWLYVASARPRRPRRALTGGSG